MTMRESNHLCSCLTALPTERSELVAFLERHIKAHQGLSPRIIAEHIAGNALQVFIIRNRTQLD